MGEVGRHLRASRMWQDGAYHVPCTSISRLSNSIVRCSRSLESTCLRPALFSMLAISYGRAKYTYGRQELLENKSGKTVLNLLPPSWVTLRSAWILHPKKDWAQSFQSWSTQLNKQPFTGLYSRAIAFPCPAFVDWSWKHLPDNWSYFSLVSGWFVQRNAYFWTASV